MAAASIPTIKPHKLLNAEPTKQDPTKFHYLYKALFLTILIILPLFPSQAPEFINQSLLTRNWELLHLLFVGIAISYGLFCRRNDGADKENNNSKFDTAQSYVSRFIQVSSFFEDDSENDETPPDGGGGVDDSKIQTWNNNYQYQRNEPVVVVAPKAGSNSKPRVSEKPLLLPVRSLKSRLVSDNPCPVLQSAHELNPTSVSVNWYGSKSGSRRLSRNAEMEGSGRPTMEDNRSKDGNSNNVVLASPIPWRSESLMKLKQNSRLSRPNPMSSSTSLSSPKKKDQSLSSSTPSFPSESLVKNSEDTVKNKGFYKSSIPLPPPPPPPMLFKSISMKPRSSSLNQSVSSSSDKEMKRSFTTSDERKDKPRGLYVEEQEVKRKGSVRFAEEEKVIMGFDEDTESEEDDEAGRSRIVKENVESVANNNNNNEEEGKSKTEEGAEDEGPDVDKKADEFIAKFREQIRLQRIDSIKRSANRMARNSSSR